MKCNLENCTGKYKKSQHQNGYETYRCDTCEDLVDIKDIKDKNTSTKDSPKSIYEKQDGESEQAYRQRMLWIMPYF